VEIKIVRILLVEDDTFIREMLQEELERVGFQVRSFERGNDGLAALHAELFDLVLLDIMLPDTNGLEILRRIKNDPITKHNKVVLLTNLGNDALIKEGTELGAVGYLVKASYNPDQIVEQIKHFL
jgi:DNA-binding response OmpR family regulator